MKLDHNPYIYVNIDLYDSDGRLSSIAGDLVLRNQFEVIACDWRPAVAENFSCSDLLYMYFLFSSTHHWLILSKRINFAVLILNCPSHFLLTVWTCYLYEDDLRLDEGCSMQLLCLTHNKSKAQMFSKRIDWINPRFLSEMTMKMILKH